MVSPCPFIKKETPSSPPSAPTPVGWPDLLPSSAEDLSLFEPVSYFDIAHKWVDVIEICPMFF